MNSRPLRSLGGLGVTAAILVVTLGSTRARADTPGFDRPGIAFAASALPRGGLAWEQGAPGVIRDEADGVLQTSWILDTRLRYGMTNALEAQLEMQPFVRVESDAAGAGTISGMGDASVDLKWAPPTGNEHLSWAGEAGVTFPTGKSGIGAGTTQYTLGAVGAWSPVDRQQVELFAGRTRSGERRQWTVSPNWSIAATPDLGAYVEAGWSFGGAAGTPENAVAGGGLTWMVKPTVQLDAYGLWGLTHESTDLQAGCGVSVYFAPRAKR